MRAPPPRQNAGGIKRTASGFAKAFDSAFEEDRGSQNRPIVLGGNTPSKIPQTDLFGEDDFDSDIDLDVEEPNAKGTVNYPTLAKPKPAAAPMPKSVIYPTLPRQQQARTGYQDSGYGSVEPSAKEAIPGSSNPFPWSSSPLEHFQPTRDPSTIRQFAYDGGESTRGQSTAMAEPREVKRRTLPWLEKKDDESASTSTAYQSIGEAMRPTSRGFATPASKADKKSQFPWNTTASAVKDQQKKHREEVKKTIKKNEGTDESISKAKSKRKQVARVFLSEEQQHVLDLVVEKKKSVFFTGSAGTGKSVLLREIITSLRKKYAREPDRIAVTASTGLAACNVGGVTLHSFAGIGLGKEPVAELVKKIKKNQKARHRWMRTKVLVVDEVSMVDGELFDKLEAIARQLRNNGRPFGGIQLVITGDFFQLPPVPDKGKIAQFAFDASTWTTSVEYTIGLHHVFRQKDPGMCTRWSEIRFCTDHFLVFAGMLNEMREGRLSASSISTFRSLSRPLNFNDDLDATELFALRSEVDRANADRLVNLQGNVEVFEARDGGTIVDKTQRDKLLSNCMAPETITLKKGAQVMLIKNIDESLVNGSIGRVIGFMDEGEFDKYCINEDAYKQATDGILSTQTPSLSKEEMARKRLTDNLTTQRKFPLVRFAIADGTSRDLLCQPESWKVELPNGEVQASRSQVPLILAWALSIHKAQGQTLERVKVDLGKVFEKGQAYVALSRATSMAGLQVLRFDPKKVNAHEKVGTFYANLARVELEGGGSGAKAVKSNPQSAKKRAGSLKAEDYERSFVEDDWQEML
jgi:ATP-dependent DNA helicase PIF1